MYLFKVKQKNSATGRIQTKVNGIEHVLLQCHSNLIRHLPNLTKCTNFLSDLNDTSIFFMKLQQKGFKCHFYNTENPFQVKATNPLFTFLNCQFCLVYLFKVKQKNSATGRIQTKVNGIEHVLLQCHSNLIRHLPNLTKCTNFLSDLNDTSIFSWNFNKKVLNVIFTILRNLFKLKRPTHSSHYQLQFLTK